jgi:S-adenosylmethionine hydrolase
MRSLVFVTDCVDIAANELRGVMRSLVQDPSVSIEPVAGVLPFSILNGAFVLRLMAEAYPPGTVFSVILNPMQVRPERLVVRTKEKDLTILGANTGVFELVRRELGIKDAYQLKDPGFVSFGGKYVHAPAAAAVLNGEAVESLADPFSMDRIRSLEIPDGAIMHIDNFGLMKLFLKREGDAEGRPLRVRVRGHELQAIWSHRMMSNPTGTWCVYPGSSFGYAELGCVRMDGAAQLGAKVGDVVEILPG